MFSPPTFETLQRLSLPELERVFADAPLLAPPKGRFTGRVMTWLGTPAAREQPFRWFDELAFGATPWGIDFSIPAWFFVTPKLKAGRFTLRAGPSRWRDTQSLSLHYEASRLPAFVKGLLYDELKPLGADLCLGLGGINRERPRGEHFFFALRR